MANAACLLLIYESFGTEESPCACSESKNAKLKVPIEVWNEPLQKEYGAAPPTTWHIT